MKRTEFKSIAGLALTVRQGVEGECCGQVRYCDIVLVRKDTNEIVAFMCSDNLFDAGGNRFYYADDDLDRH